MSDCCENCNPHSSYYTNTISGMTDDSPHLQTCPKYTNLPHCKVATSMQTCPKYILAQLFRVMHYEWAAWTKEVCFSNQYKLLNFSALHVLPCEPYSIIWREGSAIDRRAGPQTTEDMLSESPRCNDMVADLLFLRFFGTPIQCEIPWHFPRSVVKVGLNVQWKVSVGPILSGAQTWTSTFNYLSL